MHLSQLNGGGVVCRVGADARLVPGATSIYELAQAAVAAGQPLAEIVAALGLGETVDLAQMLAAGMLDCPVRHPDPAHLHLTGTGLTHLGSAATRDAMHAKLQKAETLTDSMKMFRMGLEGGKPARRTGRRAARMVLQGQRPRRRRPRARR